MTRKSLQRRFSAKRIQSLLKESKWTVDYKLTAQIPNDLYISEIYKSSDGELLAVLRDGAGILFESTETWLSYLKSLESLQNQGPIHLLHGRIPQGQNFVNQVPELIQELAVRLNIPSEHLDKSENSLTIVDRAVQRKGSGKCLEAKIFAPLVAYVGEVIKQEVNGRWEMRPTEDPETWEPWIVDSQGQSHPPFIIIYDELYESPQCSIYGSVGGQIRSHLLR